MRRRRISRALLTRVRLSAVAVAAVLAAAVTVAGSAEAGTEQRSWIARPGVDGANGVVEVLVRPGTVATVATGLRGLPAATFVSVAIRRGTCAAQGDVLTVVPSRRTTSDGRVSNRHALTALETSAVTASPSMVATIRAGSFRRCAPLIEQSPPRPAPTPTATPSPTPIGTPRPIQIGQKFISGGVNAFWLSVEAVRESTTTDGKSAVLVTVGIEAGAGSNTVHSWAFRLVGPETVVRCPDTSIMPEWTVYTQEGQLYVKLLAFLAPAAGSLDLRYGTVAIHIRE